MSRPMKNSEGWPLVSIILAVRNGENFLAEAIRSVRAQLIYAWR